VISLKRNSKKELVNATGMRTRKSSIYTPGQSEDFKVSRSKFNDFLACQRCFYLDRVKGLASPSMPGWTLNETTDLLLKKEFDVCREQQEPHRVMQNYGLDHIVPFQHEDIDKWRNSLHHGLKHRFQETNIILHGGVDDIWFDTKDKKLVVVDYKSQATNYSVDTEAYLNDAYHQSYKIQLDFYAYLLTHMGYEVSQTGYFYVCNANREAPGFFSKMEFEETLVPYQCNTSWIDEKVQAMIEMMNKTEVPQSNPSCENCAYASQRNVIEGEVSK